MSTISWTNKTWNPTVGCTRVSKGCERCYAEKVAHRGLSPAHRGLTVLGARGTGARWNGRVRLLPERLDQPLGWRKPQMVFVDSMSDLFHKGVSFDFIDRVFETIRLCPQHTFQILTKRPDRMASYALDQRDRIPRNAWLGFSAEDQETFDARYEAILPMANAPHEHLIFASLEPLLGPIKLPWLADLDWVIAGGESGNRARQCITEWLHALVRDCRELAIPCFVKQLGARPTFLVGDPVTGYEGIAQPVHLSDAKGEDPSEWPEHLRVREWPQR